MKLFIVGINGFIGSEIAKSFSCKGVEIIGSYRSKKNLTSFRSVKYALGESIENLNFSGVDAIVYCAHDFSSDEKLSYEKNVKGTRDIYFLAKEKFGVRKHVYLSSFSAHKSALSIYGKIKHQLERFFLSKNETILRLGLVIGNGGLCAKNIETIKKLPIIPLPNGGQDPLPTISINDLNICLTEIFQKDLRGEFNIFYRDIFTSHDFVKQINAILGKKTRILKISTPNAIKIMRFLVKLGFNIEDRLENLKGSITYSNINHKSDIEMLCTPEYNQKTSLEALLR